MQRKSAKLLAVVLVLTLVLGTLAGCGSKKEKSVYVDMVTSYQDAVDMEWAYDVTYKLAYDEELGGCHGFRTAGSDYEHKAADYLADLMKEIGLEDVEKVGVDVDKWQFDDASLTIKGTDINFVPASYAQNGTDADGITAEIVNAGTGLAEDYEGLDVEGKIVLVGVDQYDTWIDTYIHEAYLQGAAALVTYDIGGYAQASDDIRNMQDVCTNDYLPTVSLSANEGKQIKKAIKAGNNQCTLKVDNVVTPGEGTSYNVVGKIKGKSSEQQILVTAHYDKYFYGFQDDCVAIANVLAIGKAMKDSGYVPENDIVFVCHGAEEWGASGTCYDYTTGAWEMINTAHPEWAGKTLAMFNFELSGFHPGYDEMTIATIPEFGAIVSDYANNELSDLADTGAYDGVSGEYEAVGTMEDGVSYRFAGVPYFLNGGGISDEFTAQKYHTEADDETTYDETVLQQNINVYGGMIIEMDQNPALEIDLTAMASWLEESYDEDWAAKAGADTDSFMAELESFKATAQEMYDEAVRINTEYEAAFTEGDEDAMAKLRTEGTALNAVSLEAFGIAQKEFLAMASSEEILTRHEGAVQTLDLLQGIIDAANEGAIWAEDEESGAGDMAWQLNGMVEYGYFIFTPEGVRMTEANYFDDGVYWGTDKTIPFVDTAEGTLALVYDEDTEAAIPVFQRELDEFLPNLNGYIDREIEGMKQINALWTK